MYMMKRLTAFLLVLALLLPSLAALAEEEPAATAAPARGYVLVTVGDESRWFPLPEEEEYSFTVRQTGADGVDVINVITVTPEGVYMKESSCDNQDCVDEGIVTLENKSERVLGNMIVCLPHYVMIELYSWQEILAFMNGGTNETAE